MTARHRESGPEVSKSKYPRDVARGASDFPSDRPHAEVLAVLRRRFLIEKAVTEAQATAAVA